MRRPLLPLLAMLGLVLAVLPGQGNASIRVEPKRNSDAWMAIHHSQYDTPLTAAYESRLQAMVGHRQAPALTNTRMSNANFAGNQNEFQIDINPTNHLFAIGASNDSRLSGT